MTSPWVISAVVLLLLVASVPAARWLARAPGRGPVTWFLAILLGLFVRVYHRTRYAGREHLPRTRRAGPLIVVANHTAGLDPSIVQHVCPFFIRWMMWRKMMVPVAGPLWRWMRILPLGGTRGEDLATMREAIRELETRGVVGIFPEGSIERPQRTLRRFRSGVGLLIAKSGSPVLPIVIDDTHYAPSAWGSLIVPSSPKVTIYPVIDYSGVAAADIVADLERRYQQWTGWPVGEPASSPVTPN